MKKISIIGITLLISAGVISCSKSQNKKEANLATTQSESSIAENVDVARFKELISTKKEAILLDVRTPQEVASGSIKGNIALDYNGADFNNQLNQLDKNAPILVYCAVGGRSGNAMGEMKKMGFKEVYNLAGGIRAWTKQGNPVQ